MVMHVELQATCSALGYQEGQKYVKEPDCLETVKDLIRFLKREDETCDIRQQLGNAQILQNDLIPLVKHYKKDRSLMECVIRLMVNLTQPGILCFNNQIPEEKTGRNHYLEVESHLQTYKEAFVDEELFAVLTEKMGDMLKLDWERRHEDDKMFIERLLILVRNILHVPPNTQEEKRTDDDASVHDQVLWALHVSGMEDLLLYIASSEEERQYSVHVLEIISLMFREQTPELLAHAGVQRSMTEKEKDQRELELAREKERARKLANVMKQSSRHSRFGGTFVLKNMKSISDRDIIYHKSVGDTDSISFTQNKKPKKQPRNRQAIKDVELVRRSTLSIRLALKDFCVQFLESCYNPLMRAVKDCLMREKSQDHDETYYLWAMRFFMEFCRVHSGKVELVSETMSVPSFHYIYNNLITYYEMIMTEKKEGKTWSRRVHLALKAYQELLLTLYSMDKSRDSQIRESSKVIKSNVFYMMEFRDIFITLLRKFDESKQSRSYLKDLVETTHLFLKMLEAMCKQTAHMVVQRKKRKAARKPGKRKDKTKSDSAEPDPELEDLWDDVSSELSALIQGRAELPSDVTPFDAASEVEVDQQRVDAMIRIQQCLRSRDAGQALALFRSAREVWPDRNEFGSTDISPENEFMALREVFFSNISAGVEETQPDPLEEVEEEIEDEEETEMTASEQEFSFKDYLGRYAKPQIIKAHVILLEDFEKNSSHTNHCAIKMLHRVGIELSLMGMLFQASLFRVFQKLLFSAVAKSTHYQEFVKFAVHVVRQFVVAAQKNDKIFVELLFWKTPKEAVDIVEGYGTSESNVKQRWTEDQEQELQRLFEEYRDVDDGRDAVDHIMDDITDREKTRGQIVRQLKKQGLIQSVKDLKSTGLGVAWREEEQMELEELWEKHRDVEDGRDPVDHIMDDINDKAKTRGQIIRQLKKQGLIESAKDLKRKMPGARVWTEGHMLELRDLFDTYRHSDDPVGNIVANLEVKRSKAKVMEKILELGLVEDRKELYKKRGGGGRRRADSGSQSEDEAEAFWEEGAFIEANQTTVQSGDEGSGTENSDKPDDSASQPVDTMLSNLIDKGFRGAVEWIQRGLRRTADDRSGSASPQPVPIVPLTEESENAMEDKLFTDFLKRIGLSPPANEQETFWRIPADLTVEDLRTISDGLQLDEENRFTDMESLKTFVENRPQLVKEKAKKVEKSVKQRAPKLLRKSKKEEKTERSVKKSKPKDDFIASSGESSDDEALVSKKGKRKKSEHKSKRAKTPTDTSGDENLDNSGKGRNSSQAKSRLKRPLQSDSEDSEDRNLQIDLSDDDVAMTEPARKRSRLGVIDDSDDDSRPAENLDGQSQPCQPNITSSDMVGVRKEDKSSKRRKRKQVLDSDETSRDSTMSTSMVGSQKAKRKRKQLVDSDDTSQDSIMSSSAVDSQKAKRQRKARSVDLDSGKKTKKNNAKKSKKGKATTLGSDDSDDEMPLSLSANQTKPNKTGAKAMVSDDSEEDTPLSVSTNQNSMKENSRTFISDDSDEVSDSQATSQKKARKSSRRAVVSDESDDDTPLFPSSKGKEASQGNQKAMVSDESDEDTPLFFSQQSEDEGQKKATLDTFPATMLSVPPDSDSEDDHIPLNQALKGAGVQREGTE